MGPTLLLHTKVDDLLVKADCPWGPTLNCQTPDTKHIPKKMGSGLF